MALPLTRPLQKLRQYDQNRASFPGEHLLVLGAGLALFMASRRSPSPVKRALGAAASSALLARAASGRDGLAKVLRYLPMGRGLLR